MKTFELEIITPSSAIFKGTAVSLILPGHKGYMGIMAGHASFIGSLGNGKIFVKTSEPNPDDIYFVNDGFIEVVSLPFKTTRVTILAEDISLNSKIALEKPA
jgi:F0F1-type ATP synthase epsilon subunit